MQECLTCQLQNNCAISKLTTNEQITPAQVLDYKNNVCDASRTNISKRQIVDNRRNVARVSTIQLFGKGDKDGIVVEPRKAVIECVPVEQSNPLANIPVLNLFVKKKEAELGKVRKVVWSSESEGMKDYLSALNDYITGSWFYHLTRVDEGKVGILNHNYVQRNSVAIVDDIKSEENIDRKLYKLGYHMGLSIVSGYSKSLEYLIAGKETWHKESFIEERQERILDGIREGNCRLRLNELLYTKKIQELIQTGIESQAIISGPLGFLHEIYTYLDPHQIANQLTRINSKNVPFVIRHLGCDLKNDDYSRHYVNPNRPIPEMPALTGDYPGISSKELAHLCKGSYICPANHTRTSGGNNFLNEILNKYYSDHKIYFRTHEFARSSITTAMDFSHKAMESRADFVSTLLNANPKFYLEWVGIADELNKVSQNK